MQKLAPEYKVHGFYRKQKPPIILFTIYLTDFALVLHHATATYNTMHMYVEA